VSSVRAQLIVGGSSCMTDGDEVPAPVFRIVRAPHTVPAQIRRMIALGLTNLWESAVRCTRTLNSSSQNLGFDEGDPAEVQQRTCLDHYTAAAAASAQPQST